MRRRLVATAAVLAALAVAGCTGDGPARRQMIDVRHSAFAPSVVTVAAGRPITLLIRNDDPIAHEWIVGDDATHARHRDGTEPAHDARPTEVSVPALAERTTTVTFDRPGDYRFVCHLPGHEAYGMTGVIRAI